MDGTSVAVVLIGLQALAGAGVGLAMLALYRYVRSQSPALGAIFAAGLLLRLTIGLLLFTISYLDLPVLRGLHSSDGFWDVAPDARSYTARAARAAVEGLDVVPAGSASPTYVKMLALWMLGTGTAPSSGFFLNVAVYCVLFAIIVAAWRPRGEWPHDAPCVLACASFSFAPGAFFHGTQALKDDVFSFLVVLGGVGAFFLLTPVVRGARDSRSAWAGFFGLVALAAALYLVAGIRAYYAILIWVCLAISFAVTVIRPDWRRLRRAVPLAVGVLAVTAVSWWEGSGAYNLVAHTLARREVAAAEQTLSGLWSRAATLVGRTGTVIVGARRGFAQSGGRTNLTSKEEMAPPRAIQPPPSAPPEAARREGPTDAVPAAEAARGKVAPEPTPAPKPTPAPSRGRAAPREATEDASIQAHISRLLVGLAVLLVPISLVQGLSGMEIAGGRGLLFLTDIDTLFIDATIAATFVFLWTRRQTVAQHLPYVTFMLVLGCTTALLLAYVVTNFGTLFRLRMLMVVPFWLLLLATSNAWAAPAAITPGGQAGVWPRAPRDSSG